MTSTHSFVVLSADERSREISLIGTGSTYEEALTYVGVNLPKPWLPFRIFDIQAYTLIADMSVWLKEVVGIRELAVYSLVDEIVNHLRSTVEKEN